MLESRRLRARLALLARLGVGRRCATGRGRIVPPGVGRSHSVALRPTECALLFGLQQPQTVARPHRPPGGINPPSPRSCARVGGERRWGWPETSAFGEVLSETSAFGEVLSETSAFGEVLSETSAFGEVLSETSAFGEALFLHLAPAAGRGRRVCAPGEGSSRAKVQPPAPEAPLPPGPSAPAASPRCGARRRSDVEVLDR
jgi:hypothetical protein